MKEKSLKERIRLYMLRGWLRSPQSWCNGGTLEDLAGKAGFKPSNGGRRARDLVTEKILEREEKINPETGKNSVWYRLKPTHEQIISRNMSK